MASTEKRGRKAREAVLTYCTSWTQALYRDCWPEKGAGDATMKVMEETSRAVSDEMMAMLRHEIPEQDATASAPESKRDPAVLELIGGLGSDSEPDIMAGSFLGAYGVLAIDAAGHWTYRAGEARLTELREYGPDWFAHCDKFIVTHEEGSEQTVTISLRRRRKDEVTETTASSTVDDRVPAETFGENNEPDLRLAVERDLARKLPDPDPFNEPAPVSLWVEGQPGDDMPRREVTQDELRHLRLYPDRDELSGGGLKFVGLLFFNAAERFPVDEDSQPDDEAPETRKEKRARETGEKYKRWYDRAQEIKKGGKKTHPTEIASAIAKMEKGSTERGVNARNIRRRLDEHYPRWAERRPSQEASAK